MAGPVNREVRLARRPEGEPSLADFELVETPVPEPDEGEILVRNVCMSVDPYMHMRLTGTDSLSAPFEVGEALRGGAVGRVERSRHPDFAAGDYVSNRLGWRDYFVSSRRGLLKVEVETVAPSAYLGALGMPGLTAYVGMADIGAPREGETVYVSAAAGAVGSVAGQIAKVRGSRVVGSAGSAEKLAVLRDELGFDAAFNYRDADLAEALAEACPDGIDVYFDNVGGRQLEAAIDRMNAHGRIAACGNISERGPAGPHGPSNLRRLVSHRLTMRGFVVADHADRLPDFMREMGGWLASGAVRNYETVFDGLEHAPEALLRLFRGETIGKTIVRLTDGA